MTERERWVIYPLLFFLFLMVIRDQTLSSIEARFQDVICQRLVVESSGGRRVVEIRSQMDSGELILYGVDESADAIGASVDPPPALPVLQLGADAGGGFVTLFGHSMAPTLKLGHHAAFRISGLVAIEGDEPPRAADSPGSEQFWGSTINWPSAKSVDDAASVDAGTGPN